jgi:hypothetical protein
MFVNSHKSSPFSAMLLTFKLMHLYAIHDTTVDFFFLLFFLGDL